MLSYRRIVQLHVSYHVSIHPNHDTGRIPFKTVQEKLLEDRISSKDEVALLQNQLSRTPYYWH